MAEQISGSDNEYDIVIVGGGPVGEALAVRLGQRGHRVVVLEQHPRPYGLPRAVHYDHEVARFFANIGLDETQQRRFSHPAGRQEWHNADGALLLRFDRGLYDRSAWPTSNTFNQPGLETLLREMNDALPTVDRRTGVLVVDVSQDDDGVSAVALDGSDVRHEFRGKFLVGADGANSFVRGAIGVDVVDLGFFFDWLVIDVVPDVEREWDPPSLQLVDPNRPTTVVPGGPGRRRFELMRREAESIEELTDPAHIWSVIGRWGLTPDNTKIERSSVYRFQARWAQEWSAGRIFLAGDSAHQMPPFAGQGMCSGMRDVANLSWKLLLVLEGVCDAAVLESYTPERRRHVQNAIHNSIALGDLICVADPVAAAARDERMIAAGADPARLLPPLPPARLQDGAVQRTPDGQLCDGAGELALQGRVRRGDEEGRWDEVFGFGFALISRENPLEHLGEQDLETIDRLDMHVGWMSGEGNGRFDDLEGRFDLALQENGSAAIVVRPDFYVYGSVAELDALPALLADLRGHVALA